MCVRAAKQARTHACTHARMHARTDQEIEPLDCVAVLVHHVVQHGDVEDHLKQWFQSIVAPK